MYNFLGNSDTWDQLLEMEQQTIANATALLESGNDIIIDDVNNTIGECINGICGNLINETFKEAVVKTTRVLYADDEF